MAGDSAYERIVRALREHGSNITAGPGGRKCEAQCPHHDDHNASLSVTALNDRALVWCHHPECDTRDVMAALGMTLADLYDERSATYRYDDGRTVQRYYDTDGKKQFRQTGANPTATLYHRDRLAGAEPGKTVFLVEGEADVRAIEASGGVATTAPQGANSFHKVDVTPLTGLWITVVVDRDEAGQRWAEQVADKLDGVAEKYRFAHAVEGKDASDHLAAGYGLADFVIYTPAFVDRRHRFAFLRGGSFVLDVPDIAPAVWGDGTDVIWAQGEALMICGPSGVGKTTLALQVLRARLGLQDKVLGHSVAQTGGRILYLVMDRPAQFRRAASRLFTDDDRELLDARLVVWRGPPPQDLALHPEILSAMCAAARADTVFVDSLKDAAIGIAKDEIGAGYNRARQQAITDGFDVAELHHLRKATADNKEPNTLSDIYGSAWLTAGAGSVVLLWGEPGDPVVMWRHLKQPEGEVGPFHVVHDHSAGVSEAEPGVDLVAMVRRSGVRGLTAWEYAAAVFGARSPSRAQKEKARRQLERKAAEGVLSRVEGGPAEAARYYLRRAVFDPPD